jgi:AbrB family looped-hinge helix DNA binding protein
MMTIAKVTSKGQVTIPKEIRKFLGIEKGDDIIFEKVNNYVIIKTEEQMDLPKLANVRIKTNGVKFTREEANER